MAKLEDIDPRVLVIKKRLKVVSEIIPVMSSKGGVGKTVIATTIALLLARKGVCVGLLDLDITNPSTHIVLGINPASIVPEEEKGVIPPRVHGIEYMTIAFYSKDNPLPLRGTEVDEAIKEILAITRWGRLDYLIIDTPPGLSDPVLDVLSYMDKISPVIVTTPSPLSLKSVERLLFMLTEAGITPKGLIENIANKPSERIIEITKKYNIQYLGNIPYIENLDIIITDPERLVKSDFAKKVDSIVSKLVEANK
ncbi:P-loop NTPase [Desulfurococcaceae archaeon MEX13E-LK6-19]|nr:P-loop NTPase [Desulfurococcaceae archaeon MEX13E-LK6-19]